MCAKKFFLFTVLLLFGITCQALERENSIWPVGMSFVGLIGDNWKLYIVKPGSKLPEKVILNSEPRSPSYSPSLGLVGYISSEGNVMQYELATGIESILIKKEKNNAYTQPTYHPERNSLVLVELSKGRSNHTRIIEVNLQDYSLSIISQQRSAQFDPFIQGGNLYYTNVHCIENCAGRFVHEIWIKYLNSKNARQLTLLNSQTHQPVISFSGESLYVSSEKNHGKRIWKCKLKHTPPIPCEELKSNSVADTAPALAKNGDLYFMRLRLDGLMSIVTKDAGGKLITLPLSKEFENVRDMDIGK